MQTSTYVLECSLGITSECMIPLYGDQFVLIEPVSYWIHVTCVFADKV